MKRIGLSTIAMFVGSLSCVLASGMVASDGSLPALLVGAGVMLGLGALVSLSSHATV